MGEPLDNPNQQVVREDGSGPGIASEAVTEAPTAVPEQEWVDEEEENGGNGMTRAELLAEAQRIGASPANKNMTKADLQASIDAKRAETPED